MQSMLQAVYDLVVASDPSEDQSNALLVSKGDCLIRMEQAIEHPTYRVESDGSWTKINRGLAPEMLAIDQKCDEEIHHIMSRPYKDQP
jgi:hypothetical protein